MTGPAGPSVGARRQQAVLLVTAALLASTAGCWWVVVDEGVSPPDPWLPWWVLAGLFAVTEVVVTHVQRRHEAQSISLSELPLVLGLFFTVPAGVGLARLVGPFVVFQLHRRQRPLKLAFNTALVAADGALALAVFSVLHGQPTPADPRNWTATFVAVASAATLDVVATRVVIGLFEGRLGWRDLARALTTGPPVSLAVAVVGLICVLAITVDHRAAYFVAAATGVVLLSYRRYSRLRERHHGLERLYQFSRSVSGTTDVDLVLRHLLREAREVLRSEVAEVSLAVGERQVRVTVGRDGQLARSTDLDGSTPRLPGGGSAVVLMPHGTKASRYQQWLSGRGLREAVVVPLHGERGPVGHLLVADRRGDVRTYDWEDVQVLETVANHASVALQSGRLIERLRYDTLHDSLTGLPNRVLFLDAVAAAGERLSTVAEGQFSVLIIDLDGFKEVNDTLGHPQGDRLLVEVARRLSASAGESATVARLGGDEFAVLVEADTAYAVQLAHRMLRELERPILLDDLELEVGASVGIALAPEHGTEVSELLKRADVALYAAKRADGGVRLYEPTYDVHTPQRLARVAALRQALHGREIAVHVQPKAVLADGAVVGAEALVRWGHPAEGLLGADEVVPLAERTGLIRELTTYVLDRALAGCASWRRAGHDLGIAVNISARTLMDPGLVDDVRWLLWHHGVPSDALTLEITESSVLRDPAKAVAMLRTLADMGVRLSLDDFGTGYASFAYLTRLPVHEVKIDRSFVVGMNREGRDGAIVQSIIDLARNMGLAVVAEGVEDAAAWSALAGAGCHLAQGYHIAAPMPIEEFPAWLRSHVVAPPDDGRVVQLSLA